MRDERGSASLFAVSCLAMLLLVGAALGVVAAMVRAHRLAQSAADLAALSSAAAVGRGQDGCAAGAAIAEANGASTWRSPSRWPDRTGSARWPTCRPRRAPDPDERRSSPFRARDGPRRARAR